MNLGQAREVAGTLGYPSKMPGTSYGIPVAACKVGSKLAKVEGSTCASCYAARGNYIFRDVKKSQNKRLESIVDPLWTSAMVVMLTRAHPNGGWHRWHDSGDLQSVEHLTKICAVAALTPTIRHWLPTREIGILAEYTRNGGTVPDNLVIRVSATMIDGNPTLRWAQTSTVHKHQTPDPRSLTHICPAPTQGNKCGDCRACWQHSVGNVSYHAH